LPVVCHRQPENILATSKTWPLQVKLSDLGMAHSHLDDGDPGEGNTADGADDDTLSTMSSGRSVTRDGASTAMSAPVHSASATPQFSMPPASASAPSGVSAGTQQSAPGGVGHLIGTPGYVAPEVVRRLPGANAPPADLWSAGVVLYILLSGKMPFFGRDDAECLARTAAGDYAMPSREWRRVSPAAVSLVRGLLCVDPAKRLTAAAALQHPWLADPATLSASPLDNDLAGLRSSRRKFRRAVAAVVTMQRMQRAVAAGKAASSAAAEGEAAASPGVCAMQEKRVAAAPRPPAAAAREPPGGRRGGRRP